MLHFQAINGKRSNTMWTFICLAYMEWQVLRGIRSPILREIFETVNFVLIKVRVSQSSEGVGCCVSLLVMYNDENGRNTFQ